MKIEFTRASQRKEVFPRLASEASPSVASQSRSRDLLGPGSGQRRIEGPSTRPAPGAPSLAALCRAAAEPAGVEPISTFVVGVIVSELAGLVRNLAVNNLPLAGTACGMVVDYSVPGVGDLPANAYYSDSFYTTVYNFDRAHFGSIGHGLGLVGAPWWNRAYYRSRYNDIGNQHPFTHMETVGITEGRALSPLFDPVYYFNRYEDLRLVFGGLTGRQRHIAMLRHFIDFGLDEGRTASPLLCARAYLTKNPDIAAAFGPQGYRRATAHLWQDGLGAQRDARPLPYTPTFHPHLALHADAVLSNDFYRQVYGQDRWHFQEVGSFEGHDGAPWWSLDHYRSIYHDIDSSDVLGHMLTVGLDEGRALSPAFDPKYYYARYRGLAERFCILSGRALHVALLRHFIEEGFDKGMTGAPGVCARSYMTRYGDLRAAFGPLNYRAGLAHYWRFGLDENRDATLMPVGLT